MPTAFKLPVNSEITGMNLFGHREIPHFNKLAHDIFINLHIGAKAIVIRGKCKGMLRRRVLRNVIKNSTKSTFVDFTGGFLKCWIQRQNEVVFGKKVNSGQNKVISVNFRIKKTQF